MKKPRSHAKARNFVLWMLAIAAGNVVCLLGIHGCLSWVESSREDVLADCREMQTELEQFKAVHGRYPTTHIRTARGKRGS
jgi:hypothetical protein